ncbi:MAG: radical SAM family heme chaperone HemW [Clostridiales bacterium]|nr:radical SAM family heme chaperone HemW [Clostridiales bacterium]
MMRPVGIYIHLPFCERKCAYCDFPSFPGQLQHRAEYTKKVMAEIGERADRLGSLQVDTVFLGGGTPSMMEKGQIAAILRQVRSRFEVLPDAEISCETNPGSLSEGFLEELKGAGVNRLSLGAQSAHADELELLKRVHTWEQVVASVQMARLAGFDNINLDLMSALPRQTWEKMRVTLKAALELAPSHLSVYSLIIEEGTPFFARYENGEMVLPDDETERAIYWNTVRFLEQAGYAQYELSNFARDGKVCRHNLNTWRYHDYLGFGASAAGLYLGVRRKNPDDLFDYLQGVAPAVDILSPADARFEQLMLALRLVEGLSLDAFVRRQGISALKLWPEAIKAHIQGGLLTLTGGRLKPSRLGFDLMDRALLDFLP